MAKIQITKKRIKEILAQSVFTPSEQNTPFAQVVQFNNPSYGEYKAIELIQQAQLAVGDQDNSVYDDKITQAISILALSRAQRETIRAKEGGQIRSRSKNPS